jgi:hypothetical protein
MHQATKLIMAHMSKEPFAVAAWPLAAMAAQVGAGAACHCHTGCMLLLALAGPPRLGGCARSALAGTLLEPLTVADVPCACASQVGNCFLGLADPVLLSYAVNAGEVAVAAAAEQPGGVQPGSGSCCSCCAHVTCHPCPYNTLAADGLALLRPCRSGGGWLSALCDQHGE